MKDLGYANAWGDTPEIVKKCRKLKHQLTTGGKERSSVHVVKCAICDYIYKYDSSG